MIPSSPPCQTSLPVDPSWHHHCFISHPTSVNCASWPFSALRQVYQQSQIHPFHDLPPPTTTTNYQHIYLSTPIHMRLPPFASILRTFTLFSNATRHYTSPFFSANRTLLGTTPAAASAISPYLVRSMPTIPFLSALFSSSTPASEKMSYPDNRSNDEWRAVLNKGTSKPHHDPVCLVPLYIYTPSPPPERNSRSRPLIPLSSTEQFRILREKGTEAPFTGTYDKHAPSTGVYSCAGCSAPLYKANHKFKSGCGWPAYFDSLPGAVTRHTDSSFGMERTEIVCSNCGGHLGHVFKGEGYDTPTDERHCVNSVSLTFNEKEGAAAAGGGEEGQEKK